MTAIPSLQQFYTDALDCIRFRLIRDEQDFEESFSFGPEMAHQIFGQEETIYGYQDLWIEVYFLASSLDMCFNVTYLKKVDDVYPDEKADDVEQTFASLVEYGCYYTNLEEYKKVVQAKSASFKPFGEKIGEFEISTETSDGTFRGTRTFEVYVSDATDEEFLKFHSRLETIAYWFIDSFSRVEYDPFWIFFVVYEKYLNHYKETRYATAGYFTAYQFFSYPKCIRPRISQVLVLPPFRDWGIERLMIDEIVFNYFAPKANVADITYEKPSKLVQHIRLVVDARRCMILPSFAKEKLLAGFSNDMLQEAKQKYMINPKQCRVVYEILRLGVTDITNNMEYRKYRVEVKKRLNLNEIKNSELLRLHKNGVDVRRSFSILPTVESCIEQLHAAYKAVEEVYLRVLCFLNE